MKFKTLFIINPISGGKEKLNIPDIILKSLDLEKIDPEFKFTEYAGHASEIASQSLNGNYDILVAVGGDGTINEVASQLVGSSKILGILPVGSGNGLARELNIPLQLNKALKVLNTMSVIEIDSISLNNHFFFNMAGMGYDAQISHAFKNSKRRGFIEYIKLCIYEFKHFRPSFYNIEIDGVVIAQEAFLVSIANSSQYGNNIYISPDSSLIDGKLEVVVVEPLSWLEMLNLGLLMATKKTKSFKKIKIYVGQHVKINRSSNGPIHLDGEPINLESDLDIHIIPKSLAVIHG